MKKYFLAGILYLLTTFPPNAFAESILEEMRFGITAQGFGGWAPDKEQGAGVNLEAVFRSPEVLGFILSPRPHVGLSLATDGDATSQFYSGLEWRAPLGKKFYISPHFGLAVHTGETDTFDPDVDMARIDTTQFLGCRLLFRVSGDVGYRVSDKVSVALHASHISNAGLCTDNEGLDNMGLRMGYHF